MFENYNLIDLTHFLEEHIPSWNGSDDFHQKITMDYPEAARVLEFRMRAGIGTHMDAPSHMIERTRNIGDIPLEKLIAPACVINVSAKMHPDLFISPEDILSFEKQHGRIQKGSLFIANTGWSKKWKDSALFRNPDSKGRLHFPGFLDSTADLLLERKIVGLGIDTLSPDGSNSETYFPVHHKILGAEMYILENLMNLDKMPPKGAFTIVLPIKVKTGTEAPVRAIALVPK